MRLFEKRNHLRRDQPPGIEGLQCEHGTRVGFRALSDSCVHPGAGEGRYSGEV